jgi:hypothetical protein
MSQQVVTGQTDWSIRLWCYDSAGAAVTGLLHNSAGMSVSVVVRQKGRIISTTVLTLVARSGAGVHTDSAWTEVADGEYVVDLTDSYLATAERTISLDVAATAITGTVIVETIEVGRPAALDTDARVKLDAEQPDYAPAKASDVDVTVNSPSVTVNPTELSAGSISSIRSGLATEAKQDTMLSRLGAFTGTGVNNVLGFLRAMFHSDASTPSDMGGTATAADHSQQSIRVRGDAAWTTGSGGGGSGSESDLMVATTIATLSSQTVFTLTAGSPDNDAYNDQLVVITDASTSTQKWRGIVSDYVGSTKTVTLRAAPGFTVATGDAISIIAIGSDVSSTQLAGAVSSAMASAGIPVTITGMPTFLRVGDARTVANGAAIPVRLYSADDDSLLFGLGTQLFADATITFSLRRGGNDGTEGDEEAVIPCTWVASGGDGYVQIAYEGDALDGCDAMDKVKEKDCHRWGIKFQWGDADPITPVFGTLSVLRKIVSTQ